MPKSKAQAKRDSAARRKRKSRENQKEAGLVRLDMEPEVPVARLVRDVAEALGKTISDVVVDLVQSTRLPSMSPKWNTRDSRFEGMEVVVPEQVKAVLTGHERLSSGSVLEWLVLQHCTAPKGPDGDWSLVYRHPGTDRDFDAHRAHVPGGDRDPDGRVYDKYDERVKIRQAHARLGSRRRDEEPDEMEAFEMAIERDQQRKEEALRLEGSILRAERASRKVLPEEWEGARRSQERIDRMNAHGAREYRRQRIAEGYDDDGDGG
jgi:hypothetical protein